MKVILIFFDTLNRRFLPPYGNNWVHAPNFKRLAEKTVIFDNHYCGSLMCMPDRRELHTGRYNFLHRSWGPLEPFDDSMPRLLKEKGVYTHLVSDHYHYWEDGGATYHTQYNTWEFMRGHEGDPWKGEIRDPEIPEHVYNMREKWPHWRQDWVNRKYMQEEENMPQSKTFKGGLEFLEKNHGDDNWFLHLETFDPHEPFFTPKKYKELYKDDYEGPHFDWPNYNIVVESEEQVDHCRKEYAASLSMCDYNLGKILDFMDAKDMWKDTMLIVSTDHGFLLGEKNWWGKAVPPIYNEISHIPLFIWDPRSGKKNERRNSLVQSIDLAPTVLEFFRIRRPKDMQGKVLKETINSDAKVRETALFGTHGSHVNITDGRYVYMRAPMNPLNKPLYNYTLMPTHMRGFFSLNEIKTIEISEPFDFTKGCKVMRFNARYRAINPYVYGSYLFDLQSDPHQENSINEPDIEKHMIKLLITEMKRNDAPIEQFERLGLPYDEKITDKHLDPMISRSDSILKFGESQITWKNKGKSMFYLLLGYVPNPIQKQMISELERIIIKNNLKEINEETVIEIFDKLIPKQLEELYRMMIRLVKEKAR